MKLARVVAGVIALAGGACAPRAPAPVVVPDIAREAMAPTVDALIGPGCYRCLESAYATLDSSQPEALFQVAALLALRSKELGLPFERWIDRAAAAMPSESEWGTYLDIVRSVRVDPLSGDREVIMAQTLGQRRPVSQVQQWRGMLTRGPAAPSFRAYLDLTLACSLREEDRDDAIAGAELLFGDVPLLRYRMGTCGSQTHLVSLRDSHPEFADADLPLGRNALEDPLHPDQEEAMRRFGDARAAFPESPLILSTLGAVHQDREEWTAALEAYDEALRLVPTHRDALLGRAVALSNLMRHEEAIAAATRLLDLGNWFLGAAHFWRAWNLYNLGQMDGARADVDQAKAGGRGAATLVLSGMVAWRQQQLDLAEREFDRALQIDRGQCEAASLLGGVRASRQQWVEAADALQHAQQCFDLSIAVRRKLIDDVTGGPGTPEGRAGQVVRHERAIAEAETNRNEAREMAASIERRLAGGGR